MTKATSLVYIISDIDKSLGFEWTANEFKKRGLSTYWLLLNRGNSQLEDHLKSIGLPVYRITFNGKYSVPKAIIQIIYYLLKLKPKVVHTHLFDASLCGLTAAWLCNIPQRVYTRHHSTFHHVFFPRAVLYDRFISALATRIVAVSQTVEQVLTQKEKVESNKIMICNHGFDFKYFENLDSNSIDRIKEKYGLLRKSPIIGIVARYVKWKGHQYIIEAYKQFLIHYPNACLLLANAKGSDKAQIQQALEQLPSNSYVEIPFESDLKSLYSCMTMYVHCPISEDIEAFGQTYIEALIMKVPSVFTLSGIAKDIIHHEQQALVVPFEQSQPIFDAMIRLMNNPLLVEHLRENGYRAARSRFELERMIDCLEYCYKP